jgi:hypothetical protein
MELYDFLGEWLHRNYPMFYDTLAQTSFKDYKSYRDFSVRKLNRTVRLSRSYAKCLGNYGRHRLKSYAAAVGTYPLSGDREYNAD